MLAAWHMVEVTIDAVVATAVGALVLTFSRTQFTASDLAMETRLFREKFRIFWMLDSDSSSFLFSMNSFLN